MLWMNPEWRLRLAGREGQPEANMDRGRPCHYIGRMNFGTWLFTWFHGRLVGHDTSGNRYFEERRARPAMRQRRWVAYAGPAEASAVPPEWHAWLHYTTDSALPEGHQRPWQKPHLANLTGTPEGYRPPGHDYQGGNRAAATGDYEAWTPGT